MDTNNRMIVAVVLMVLVWSAYSLYFVPQQQPEAEQSEAAQSTATDNSAPAPVVAAVSLPTVIPAVPVTDQQIISVQTEVYHVQLSSVGGAVRFIDLIDYKQTNAPDSGSYVFFDGVDNNLFTLITSGSDGLSIPSNLPFSLVDSDSSDITITGDTQDVKLVATHGDLTIYKTYTFYKDKYTFDCAVSVVNNSDSTVAGSVSLSLITPVGDDESDRFNYIGPQSFDGEELIESKVDELKTSPQIYQDSLAWSGFTTKYFISIVDPGDSYNQVYLSATDGFVENRFSSHKVNLAANATLDLSASAYFGPRQAERLAASGHDFEKTINYGFFHPLAKPLVVALNFFYKFLGNYGFAIILLTLCIKLIFWPLTQKSYKSMKGMQKLQPEMKSMREKYSSDKQKLNEEMMKLYKEHKVNPLSGCLPMLIQIPVFFALYRALLGSIELRHAPFILWITDLSAKDPYYVTPIIMGATMFIQQKMTPSQMDPTQEKVMLMMPLVFTFMFLNFPAGLVVYWMVNNLLTILQQYLIKRQPS